MTDPRILFAELFNAAVAAADPARGLAANLPPPPEGRCVVIGAGKASAQMAAAFEAIWPGPLSGVIVTRHGAGTPCRQIEVIEAGHPIPDAAGLAASQRLLDAVSGLGPDDLVVALISGGGSALLAAPPEGMSLDDEIAVNRALLASGAPIGAMNAVRKQLSRIKGGRLALAAAPARVVSFVVSDVPGDDPAQVASGPTIPDAGTRAEARAIIDAWRLVLPPAALAHLATAPDDAPRPGDPRLARNRVHVIASAARSLEAVAAVARARGIPAVILSDAIEGEARDVALVHAAIAREVVARDRPFAKPVLLLSGGETTVTLNGPAGRGGRNSEFLLAFAQAIEGVTGIHAFAADTDGIDGTDANAGAFADHTTATRLRARGHDPRALLAGHDAVSAFEALGDLFVSGPTGTNVNDLRAVLIT